MTVFFIIVTIACLVAGLIGYRCACNDLLQQDYSERKITYRLAQLIGVSLILLLVWSVADGLLKLLPLVIWGIIGGIFIVVRLTRKRNTQTEPNPLRETALQTVVSMGISEFLALLVCAILPWFDTSSEILQATSTQISICYGLLLTIGSLLPVLLIMYLRIIDDSNTDPQNKSRAKAKFREQLRTPVRF